MTQRELLINLGLLGAIILLAYYLLTLEPERHIVVYTDDRIEKLREKMADSISGGIETAYTTNTAVEIARIHADYPEFFKQPLFDPLVPTPTPTPVPSPTATPPAELAQVVAQWKFQYGYDGKAGFKDQQNNQTFEMNIGDIRNVTWGRYSVDVELTAIDEDLFTATVGFEGQSHTFSF